MRREEDTCPVTKWNFSNVVSGEIYRVILATDYEITRVPPFILSRKEKERDASRLRDERTKEEKRNTKEGKHGLPGLIEADLHNYKCQCYKYDSESTWRRSE